jgi:hypothetical protein
MCQFAAILSQKYASLLSVAKLRMNIYREAQAKGYNLLNSQPIL